MSEKEAFDAREQARREVTSRPELPCHETAMRIYLAGFAYAQSHPHPSTRFEQPEQADEPRGPR